ncbi:MAG TPA: hypothetical protein VMW79_06000 [Anaerolineae bacterium]|nr:hypothetical protein [Anaerolineae bacterium]HUW96015.1 hypothetical protein [Anaerolineae bacterium]
MSLTRAKALEVLEAVKGWVPAGVLSLEFDAAVSVLSSCACGKPLYQAICPLAISYANGTFNGLLRIELSGEILQGRKQVRVFVLPAGEPA